MKPLQPRYDLKIQQQYDDAAMQQSQATADRYADTAAPLKLNLGIWGRPRPVGSFRDFPIY